MHRKADPRQLEPGGSSNRAINHFSHKNHPLFLKEYKDIWYSDLCCYGCDQPIWGPSYGCIWCNFFLHQSCAELPQVHKTHPMHSHHPITLLPHPPFGNTICNCAACGKKCERFFYSCSKCGFYLDIICLSTMEKIQQTIQHESHDHQLIHVQRPALFLCSGCGTEHRGASYLCTTCGFWVNQKCASLPKTIKCRNHHHSLALLYSLPDEYYQFRPQCDICSGNMSRRHWVYLCVGCRYFAHVNCATSKAEQSRECETEVGFEQIDPNLISLPLADQSVDPLTLFIKHNSLQEKYKRATEITHISHKHPLIFVDKIICDAKLPLLTEDKQVEICNGCAQPISASYFTCSQCNFFLHEYCAELHNELLHPCHPEHPLRLIAEPAPNFRPRNCACCSKWCINVFMFGCLPCEFYLDIRCAFLPNGISHEAHKRALSLRRVLNIICSICSGNVQGFVFGCDACSFILCYFCALLPSKFTHRWDKHPFSLTYSPVENHMDEYYCEICEREINPKRWYYHCVDCDQSLHTGCAQTFFSDLHLNVKFGDTIEVDKHPHHLNLVRCPKNKRQRPSCSGCCGLFMENDVVFECAPCNFWLHHKCAHDASASKTSSAKTIMDIFNPKGQFKSFA